MHFTIQSNVPNAVTITQKPNERQREQVITIKANHAAELVTVKAYNGDGKAADCADVATCVPPLQLKIVSSIALPDENTEAGILARLLLAESISPGDEDNYGDGEDVLRSMRLMRTVLENRIKAAQASQALRSYVSCNPASMDFRGIIFANQCGGNEQVQFEGFRNGVIASGKLRNINFIVSNANEGSHLRFSLYRKHVEEAINIAEGANLSAGALSSTSLLYWRTLGSGKPTPHSVLHTTLGGQEFYSLTQGYLANPNQPGPTP